MNCYTVVKEVWQETFPDQQSTVQNKMDKRRERARLAKEWEEKQKEMSQEELDAMEADIPEWKRGALVVASDDEEEQEKPGYFSRVRSAAADRINQTEAAQNFYKSDEFAKIEDMRKELKDFKSDLREQVDASHSPVVQAANQAADKLFSETACAQAVASMKKYDPEFDIEELGDEASEIFQEFYCNFLTGN